MSIAIGSSSGRPASSDDHRRHQLGQRRDRRHVVRRLGVDRAVGRRVEDDRVGRREPAAWPGRARAAPAPPPAASGSQIAPAKTMVRRSIHQVGPQDQPLYSTRLGASPIPLANQGLVGYSVATVPRERPAKRVGARQAASARRIQRVDAARRRQRRDSGVARRLAPALRSAAAATSARTRRPAQEARHGCRARRCGRASSTRISSASTIVDSRCAIVSVVRFCAIRRSSAWIAFSDFESSARGRLVEDQDPRVLQHRAGDRHALLLAAGELQAALADRRRVALGQCSR